VPVVCRFARHTITSSTTLKSSVDISRVERFYMRKFQNVNFEKPVVLKVAHDYNNKKIVLQLFKILRSSIRASALKIKFFLVDATF
jgi:hypothetical protein